MSLTLAVAALGLMFAGDPGQVSLLVTSAGLLSAVYAIRHGQADHVATHLGLNMGLLNLAFWTLLVVVLQPYYGVDFSQLLDIPAYRVGGTQ